MDTPVEEKIQREQEEIFVNGQCYVEWLKVIFLAQKCPEFLSELDYHLFDDKLCCLQ